MLAPDPSVGCLTFQSSHTLRPLLVRSSSELSTIWLPPSHGPPFWLGSPTIFTKLCSPPNARVRSHRFGYPSLPLGLPVNAPTATSVARRLLISSSVPHDQRRRFSRDFAPPASIPESEPTNCTVRTLSVSDNRDTLHRALPRSLSATTFVTSRLSKNAHSVFNVAPTSFATPVALLRRRLPQAKREREVANQAFVSSLVFQTPPSSRTARYCPVAPANSPDPFKSLRSRSTTRRRQQDPLRVHLACHSTPLRMALQAPLACEALGPKANRPHHFGTRAQAFRSLPTFPISKAPSLASRTTSTEDPSANVNPQNNLPTSEAYNATDPFKPPTLRFDREHRPRKKLSETRKNCFVGIIAGHVGFKKVQFILRSGVVSKTEESRRLQTAACRLTSFPNALRANMGSSTDDRSLERRPPRSSRIERTLSKRTIFCRVNASPSTILFAALATSTHLRWQNETRRHVHRRLHLRRSRLRLHFCRAPSQLELARDSQGKETEQNVSQHRRDATKYLADNSKTFTSAEFSRNLAEFQQVIDSPASVLTITMGSPNATSEPSWRLHEP
ncbi:hypothetical protein MHU86_23637 [Fragilaria crotonensis]|nr:hypothetical protein MHU86_23637 [Fragilaria crotonensis]